MRNTGLMVLGLAALTACVDASNVTEPPVYLQSSVSDTLPDDPSRPDEIPSSRIARRIPGFGGMSTDNTGALVVYLTNPGNSAAAAAVRAAVAERLEEHSRHFSEQGLTPRLEIRQGRFTFAQLRRLRDRLNDDILRTPGVLFTDVDELANRFVVGIDASQAAAAQAAVRKLAASRGGGDPDALEFEVRYIEMCLERTCQEPKPILPPPSYAIEPNIGPSDMRALMDTMPGGAQVTSQRKIGEGTMGFVLYHCAQADVTEMYANQCRDWYVVTSHQTFTRAAVDGDPFFHPNTYYGSPQIGVEAIDTRYHEYPFPVNVDGDPSLSKTCQPNEGYRSLVCRRSDMALIKPMTGSVKPKRGFLLRPLNRIMDKNLYSQQHTFGVNPNSPYMRISGEGIANVGYTVDKLGVTTGWRVGRVTRTCVDIGRYGDTNWVYVLRCQTELDIHGEGGDSGGPVFVYNIGENTARLLGLYHGGSAVGGTNYKYYSPLNNIRNDLGLPTTETVMFRVTAG
jgi:hypothetical protein